MFTSDSSAVYPVGKFIAQHDLQNALQAFLYEQPAVIQEITALAISPNLKYLAVCELHSSSGLSKPGRAQVSVIFLPTRRFMRTLSHPTMEGPVTCAAFSPDNKVLIAQVGAPEHSAIVWHWEKGKVRAAARRRREPSRPAPRPRRGPSGASLRAALALTAPRRARARAARPAGTRATAQMLSTLKARAAVTRIRFNPEQAQMVSSSSPMRVVRLSDKGYFKDVEIPAFRKLGGIEVAEHIWLSGSRLLVLTADGLAHGFTSGEHMYTARWWVPAVPREQLTPSEPRLLGTQLEKDEDDEAAAGGDGAQRGHAYAGAEGGRRSRRGSGAQASPGRHSRGSHSGADSEADGGRSAAPADAARRRRPSQQRRGSRQSADQPHGPRSVSTPSSAGRPPKPPSAGSTPGRGAGAPAVAPLPPIAPPASELADHAAEVAQPQPAAEGGDGDAGGDGGGGGSGEGPGEDGGETGAEGGDTARGGNRPRSRAGSVADSVSAPSYPPYRVTCVCPFAQGVLAGTSDGAALLLVDDGPSQRLRLAATVRLDMRPTAMITISVSPTEADALMQFADNQIGTFSLRAILRQLGLESNVQGGAGVATATAKLDVSEGRPARPSGEQQPLSPGSTAARPILDVPYELLSSGFHRGALTGLAAAIAKPLLVSCGEDGSVRVCAYGTPRATLLVHTCEDGVPLSVGIHPLGVQMCLVRKDRVSLMEVGTDALWIGRELHIAHATRAVYSTAGAYIAVACGSTLTIIAAFSGMQVARLQGHTGTIHAMQWAPDDMSIASAGSDGMIYRWSVADGTRIEEHHAKGVSYHAVAVVVGVKSQYKEGTGKKEEGEGAQAAARPGDPASGLLGGATDVAEAHELRARQSRGVIEPHTRTATVAIGTDMKLRLVSSGDVSEVSILSSLAAADERHREGADAGRDAAAATTSVAAAAASAAAAKSGGVVAAGVGSSAPVKFTSLAAMHGEPILFAGTQSGEIHVFTVEARYSDDISDITTRRLSLGGMGGPRELARRHGLPDGDRSTGAGTQGGPGVLRLTAHLNVAASSQSGATASLADPIAVLVPGGSGAKCFQAHHGRVGRLTVTADDCFLLSAADDGSVFIFSISLQTRAVDALTQPVSLSTLATSDVVSIGRRTIDELKGQLEEAQLAAAERDLTADAAVARVEAAWRERTDQKERSHNEAVARLERSLAEAHAARMGEASAFTKRLGALAQHADNQRREAASHLEGVLKLEIERAEGLQHSLAAQQESAEARLGALGAQLGAERAKAAEAAAVHAREIDKLVAEAQSQLERTRAASEEVAQMVEEEYESEVSHLKRDTAAKLDDALAVAAQLRVDRMVDRNQMAKRQERIEQLERSVAEKQQLLVNSHARIEALEGQRAALHAEIEARERTLGERERQYHELSETAVKLVNCRDMLDSRVKELEVRRAARGTHRARGAHRSRARTRRCGHRAARHRRHGARAARARLARRARPPAACARARAHSRRARPAAHPHARRRGHSRTSARLRQSVASCAPRPTR